MKKKKNTIFFSSFIIVSSVLFISGCTDSTTQETWTTSAQEIEKIPDQTIETSNYIISIYEGSQGKTFSVQTLDQSYIVSNISESELVSDFPEAFDELTLDGFSDGLNGKIYYDDPSKMRF